jgi:hypothetical protein
MLTGEGIATIRKIHHRHLDRNPLDVHKSACCDYKEFFGLLPKPLYHTSHVLSSDITV